jgi:hypothetical protein
MLISICTDVIPRSTTLRVSRQTACNVEKVIETHHVPEHYELGELEKVGPMSLPRCIYC